MEPIPGVDLQKAATQANEAYVKVAMQRVVEFLKSLKVQSNNLLVKETRLRTEADQAKNSRATIEDRIKRIESGDWSAMEPVEMSGAKTTPIENKEKE